MTSTFQNVMAGLASKYRVRLDRLEQQVLEVDGLSSVISARLQLALTHTQRDLQTLGEQSQLAGSGKGWLLESLNRYRLGFDQGAREALTFDRIYR